MISPIQGVRLPVVTEAPAAGEAGQKGPGFGSMLESAMGSVEDKRRQAGQSVENFLEGGNQDVHGVLLDVQRAELAFELFVQVRNKVIQAYQEIMRMPL